MNKVYLLLVSLILAIPMSAQKTFEIPVWPNGAAESSGIENEEKVEGITIINNKEAVLYVYLPEKSESATPAVIICPGGGYIALAMDHEGHTYAKWLAENGIAGIVLKYRMPNGHHEIPLKDAKEAIRITRKNAKEWNIDTQKIGISGFSAGGHLASTAGTHFDNDTRPDFMVLFYPVITMDANKNAHIGSRDNLLGNKREAKQWTDYYSNELHVSPYTPPTLLLLSNDDTAVPPCNSINFYNALKYNGVNATMYIFPEGGHGWGLNESFPYCEEWKNLYLKWLKYQKII